MHQSVGSTCILLVIKEDCKLLLRIVLFTFLDRLPAKLLHCLPGCHKQC